MSSFHHRPVRIVILSGPIQRRDAISDVVLSLLHELTSFFRHAATEVRVLCPYSEINDKNVIVVGEAPSNVVFDLMKRADAVIVTFGYQNDNFNLLEAARQAVRCLLFFGVTPPSFLPKRIHSELIASLRQVATLSRFDIIAFTSEYLLKQLLGAGMDLRAATLTKISLPLRSEFFKPNNANTMRENKIIYCGRFVESKGVKELIQAFAGSKFAIDKYKLVLIGSKSYSDHHYLTEIREIIYDLELSEIVSFEFDIATVELVQHYDSASLFASGSMHEGFGYPIAEAIARETPILCGSFTAMSETSRGLAVYFDTAAVDPIRVALDRAYDLLTEQSYQIEGRTVPIEDWRAKASTYHNEFLSHNCFTTMFSALADAFNYRFNASGYNGYVSSFAWTYAGSWNDSALYLGLHEELIELAVASIGDGSQKSKASLLDIKSAILRTIPKNNKKYTSILSEKVAHHIDAAEARRCVITLMDIFTYPNEFMSKIILSTGGHIPIDSTLAMIKSEESNFLVTIDKALEPLGDGRRNVDPLRQFAFAILFLKEYLESEKVESESVLSQVNSFFDNGGRLSDLRLPFRG